MLLYICVQQVLDTSKYQDVKNKMLGLQWNKVKIYRHNNKRIIHKYLSYLAAQINFFLFNDRSSRFTVPK
jgi:hypothetical protein